MKKTIKHTRLFLKILHKEHLAGATLKYTPGVSHFPLPEIVYET